MLSGPDARTLSLERIENVFREMMKHALDDESIKLLAYNVFTSISREEKFGEKQMGSGVNAEKRKSRALEMLQSDELDMENFVKALLRADVIDFNALSNA